MPKKDKMRIDIILDAIKSGMTQKDAASLAGVDETTVIRWKKTDASFANLMVQKEIEFKQSNVEIIRKAATSGIWTAAAWFLERKYPSEFAVKQDITDDAKKKIEELQEGLKGYFKENVGTSKNKMGRDSSGAQGGSEEATRPVRNRGKVGK